MDFIYMGWLVLGAICVIGAIWCAYGIQKYLNDKDKDK